MSRIGISREDKIIADHANSENIVILQKAGFNVVPCRKGNGSVQAGIDTLQSLDLNITYDSIGWLSEQENYMYKKDKDGSFTNEPIKKFDDCWSAARYYIEDAIGIREAKVQTRGAVHYSRKYTSF